MVDKEYALIDISQFYRELIVCMGNKETLRKCLLEYHDENVATELLEMFDDDYLLGRTIYSNEKNVFVLWIPRKPKTAQDMGFLSHEIFHAACAVMSGIGCSPSDDSEEVYAYLITYLTEKILKEFSISFSSCQESESGQMQPQTSPSLESSDSSEVQMQ